VLQLIKSLIVDLMRRVKLTKDRECHEGSCPQWDSDNGDEA